MERSEPKVAVAAIKKKLKAAAVATRKKQPKANVAKANAVERKKAKNPGFA